MFLKKRKGKVYIKSLTKPGSSIIYGVLGLKSLNLGTLKRAHIEYTKLRFKQVFKKTTKLWFKSGLIYPITKKPQESRMGKGKGKINYYIYRITKGLVFLEVSYSYTILHSILFLNYISMRLPLLSSLKKKNVYI
jgi:large subunit ribosomal protein L16